MDSLFLVDIFLCFNTAYYDEDYETVEDRCVIAKTYLSGWFTIDLLAIFPFDLLTSANNANEMIRLTRLGRMYKIVKLVRLVRVLKLQKSKSRTRGDAHEQARVDVAFKRIMLFVMNFTLLTHIFSCFWIIVG